MQGRFIQKNRIAVVRFLLVLFCSSAAAALFPFSSSAVHTGTATGGTGVSGTLRPCMATPFRTPRRTTRTRNRASHGTDISSAFSSAPLLTQSSAVPSPSAASSAAAEAMETPPPKRRRLHHHHHQQGRGDEETPPKPFPSTPELCLDKAATRPGRTQNDLNSGFVDLHVPPAEFRPSASLTTGQSFHWKAIELKSAVGDAPAADTTLPKSPSSSPSPSKSSSPSSAWGTHDGTDWIGTLRVTNTTTNTKAVNATPGPANVIVVHVRETPDTTLYKTLYAPPNVAVDACLRDYFQLHVPLAPLYQQWAKACPRLREIAPCIPGVRVLQQDPWETLVSFICSANNNIPRITKILSNLRREYGKPIPLQQAPEEEPSSATAFSLLEPLEFYTFPSLEELQSQTTEADLRRLGWGYRAKYLMQTMEILHQLGGEEYLLSLRQEADPHVVQTALLQMAGVGRKVADCIALFSLGQTKAIPVDVHVWNIARRDYDSDQALARANSLTPKIYRLVGDRFRARFGEHCGWAHSLLFVAELPSFRPVLPAVVIHEMEAFRAQEKLRKEEVEQTKARNTKTRD